MHSFTKISFTSKLTILRSRHNPAEVTATGRRVVENAGSHFYFTEPGPAGPEG